ncbi:MAG: hypothetical protein NTX79_05460 [Candidatus Micrarchaeota archaeon]|nr:hypothetical protein [Candidatus Micrarchaeota archaeon]
MQEDESEKIGGVSPEDIEMLAAEGLKQIRAFSGKPYGLAAVAGIDNEQKCDALRQLMGEYKAQGVPCKLEEKAQVIALYVRLE